jgi:translation initiation factor 1 (eIF-1/SUI1)
MQCERIRLWKRLFERKEATREYQYCIVLLEARARELMLCGEARAEAKARVRIVRKARRAKARLVTLIRLEADVN